MRVYVDLVIMLNIAMDFLLLLSVSLVLKRNVSWLRIILGSLIGGMSLILLFVPFNNLTLFLFKILVSVLMILVTFSFHNFKYFFNNLLYLYLSSIILGGGLYLLDVQLNYHNQGLMFINNGFGLNLLVLVIISPIIVFSYIKSIRKAKKDYKNLYKVDVYINNQVYKFTAFLDTGNRLYDPYKKRPIVIANTNKIDIGYDDSILVPFQTTSGNGVLKCIKVDKLVVDGTEVFQVLLGISQEHFHIEGVDMLLHNDIIGGNK